MGPVHVVETDLCPSYIVYDLVLKVITFKYQSWAYSFFFFLLPAVQFTLHQVRTLKKSPVRSHSVVIIMHIIIIN